ncbi:hypothetical protein PINS_up012603 [Pythium insidiosum]|nr:hypothetical protein PINS_up012603 [Pythium insidiosum]
MAPPSQVLVQYACPCGRWAPLRDLFVSEQCRKLVCRAPSCSLQEFEAYYCGHLLVNLPSKEASLYQNRSSRCFACVDCGSVLSTVFHESQRKFFFACPHCHWDSLALGLVEDDPDTLLMTAVARERESHHEDVFHTLLSHHSALMAGAAVPGPLGAKRGVVGRSGSALSLAESMKELQREQQMKKFRLQRMSEMGTWKYEHAIARVAEREQWLETQRTEHAWPELQAQLARLVPTAPPAEDDPTKAAQQSDLDAEVSSLAQRLVAPLEQSRSSARLFPHRPLLRVKRTWRCVESMERGSAGILVKPQISPMSGDSSLPIPAAWFKKATLGVHFVPIVTFQTLPTATSTASRLECDLLIENPLDDCVQLTVRAGESDGVCRVLLEDETPVAVGAYEDPSIADAFAASSGGAGQDTKDASATRNRHLVSSRRNLVKLRVPLQVTETRGAVSFRLQLESVKMDDALQEPIVDTAFSCVVELSSPVVNASASSSSS